MFRYAWIFFLLIECANGAIWWYRAQPKIAADPTLEPGIFSFTPVLLVRW